MIVYIEGLQVILSKTIIFLFLKMDIFLANNVAPNEMSAFVTYYLGLHCASRHFFQQT